MKTKKLRSWMLREFGLRFATQIRENKLIFSDGDVIEYMRGTLQHNQDQQSLHTRTGYVNSKISLNEAYSAVYGGHFAYLLSRKRKERN